MNGKWLYGTVVPLGNLIPVLFPEIKERKTGGTKGTGTLGVNAILHGTKSLMGV